MKRFSYRLAVVFLVLAVLAGCGGEADRVFMPESAPVAGPVLDTGVLPVLNAQASLATSAVIGGYLVEFDGRIYDSGQTTFHYTVSGIGAEHALSYFFLALPDCAPALDSYDPPGAYIATNPYIGIYGIKWEIPLGPEDSRAYSITFPGDVPMGVVAASVKASTLIEIDEIAGPCGGFEIAGSVYTDANDDGARNASEPGIADVTVRLTDGIGRIQTAVTDANGEYSFLKIAGTYTLSIDMMTPETDFNESLYASFDPTGPVTAPVTVGPDSYGNDFGFYPQTEEITQEIATGVLITTGESAAYWLKQVRWASHGGNPNSEFAPEMMAQFIADIQGLYFPDPFQFTPGNEYAEVIEILKSKSKDPLVELIRELLTAELNQVSGKGLITAPELQEILLAWTESIVIEALTPAVTSQAPDRIFLGQGIIDDRVSEALNLLVELNGAIGGGSGGGG